jgi:hypothetical protein
MIADKILEISRIYPPHSADAAGSKVTVLDAAVYRLL